MPTPLPPLPEVAPQYRIENGLYKDQYSSFPLSEDFDMGVSPTKSEKGRRGHHSEFPPVIFWLNDAMPFQYLLSIRY